MNDEVIAAAERILSDREIFEHGCGECCVLAQIDSDGFPTAATISPSKIDGMGYYYKGPEDEQFCVLKFTTQRYSLMLNEHDTSNNARGAL